MSTKKDGYYGAEYPTPQNFYEEKINKKDIEIQQLKKEKDDFEFCFNAINNKDQSRIDEIKQLKITIETLTKLVDSDTKALEKKDQVITEAKEIIGALWAWFNIKSTRVAPIEYLEKAKKWMGENK